MADKETTVYRCQFAGPDEACGLDGFSFDTNYDECGHMLALVDAETMAEALNVQRETGLTPRQLVARTGRILAALLAFREHYHGRRASLGSTPYNDYMHAEKLCGEVIAEFETSKK